MAGTDQSFDRTAFEAGVRFAMKMGAPPNPADQPTFYFRRVRSYPPGTVLDQEGRPLDPSVQATFTEPSPITLAECAVEFDQAVPEELPVGVRIPTRLTLTMLDAEYQRVRDAVAVAIGGDRYQITYRLPPIGLFEATVYRLVAYAEAES